MKQYAAAGNLIPLNGMVDMTRIQQQYSSAWINLGTMSNNLYALFIRAANKSMVWYNPATFSANNWQTPSIWDDMIALSNKIVSVSSMQYAAIGVILSKSIE